MPYNIDIGPDYGKSAVNAFNDRMIDNQISDILPGNDGSRDEEFLCEELVAEVYPEIVGEEREKLIKAFFDLGADCKVKLVLVIESDLDEFDLMKCTKQYVMRQVENLKKIKEKDPDQLERDFRRVRQPDHLQHLVSDRRLPEPYASVLHSCFARAVTAANPSRATDIRHELKLMLASRTAHCSARRLRAALDRGANKDQQFREHVMGDLRLQVDVDMDEVDAARDGEASRRMTALRSCFVIRDTATACVPDYAPQVKRHLLPLFATVRGKIQRMPRLDDRVRALLEAKCLGCLAYTQGKIDAMKARIVTCKDGLALLEKALPRDHDRHDVYTYLAWALAQSYYVTDQFQDSSESFARAGRAYVKQHGASHEEEAKWLHQYMKSRGFGT